MTLTDARPPTSGGPAAEHGERQALLARLARFSGRRRRLVMLVWVAVIVLAAPLALSLTSALSGAGWEVQGSTAQKVRDELRRDFPQAGAEAAIVAYHQDAPDRRGPGGPAHPARLPAGRPGSGLGRRSARRCRLTPV